MHSGKDYPISLSEVLRAKKVVSRYIKGTPLIYYGILAARREQA